MSEAYGIRGAHGMLASVSKERYEALENFAEFARGNDGTIANALRTHARNMREVAEQTRAAYESGAGTETPEASPGHMNIAITNTGYKQMAELFNQQADAAEQAADEFEARLEKLLDIE